MVGILIRMKWSVLRHSMSSQRANNLVSGISLGLLVAVGTIWLATRSFSLESLSIDVLAATFSLWLLGWIMGPIFFGGGDQTLRPEHFTLLPIPPRRLTLGLLSTAFVGPGALVTLVAFTSLIVYGARGGIGPLLVAIPAAFLQLVLIILLSRLTTEVFNQAMSSQIGAALGALISATIMALLGSGWALVPTISQALTLGFPPLLSGAVRALPSGWGLVAIDAASRSNWLLSTALIFCQVALIGLLLMTWSALLVRRTTTKKATHPSKWRMGAVYQHHLFSTTPIGAVLGKELVSWLRDPMRMHYFYFALFYALLFCFLPLALGLTVFIPFVSAIFIVMAAMITNFYGTDGSALWLTLVVPHAERYDVRGRQAAWVLVVAPTAMVLTIVCTAVSGQSWAWPWVLALLPALLGGAAGLLLLTSVFYLVPRTEPHLRKKDLLQASSDMGQAVLMLVLVPITAIPAASVVLVGMTQNNALLQWVGVGVGIATGALFSWLLGRIAYRRLEARGSELLHLMRSGSSSPSRHQGANGLLSGLSRAKRQVVLLCLSACWIPLIPQGIVPMVMKLSGTRVLSWFLALYLPEPYQWPIIIIMITVGLLLFCTGLFIIIQNKRAQPSHS
ncbi:hypothetical protein KSD_61320 [Ktedonobacter sp. SOSP1-85]|uniref:hypothetical protein n=1 Tax=Ktedonobacter sp. SOSP1-85 TaxID=2778367 RepID=UPI0019163990|nr:hypothetical protein [Ktedonobacter sp. SOSP1-85]GHO78361.1 hypothetical protein KSD_61320 [Ktedonobacter sp. SOSP1-85]